MKPSFLALSSLNHVFYIISLSKNDLIDLSRLQAGIPQKNSEGFMTGIRPPVFSLITVSQ
jgi:hypothetical protein